MDDDRNFDIESLRKSRWEKICNWFEHSFGWIRKRGWIEVEAEVRECIKPNRKSSYDFPYYPNSELLSGENLIVFAYTVEGKTYTGTQSSRDEVQIGDKFSIWCNPRSPEENNSIDSESNWTVEYTVVIDVIVVALFVGLLIWSFFKRG